jgi:biotin operon repressor
LPLFKKINHYEDKRATEVLIELRKEGKADYLRTQTGVFWLCKELMEKYINSNKALLLQSLTTKHSYSAIGREVCLSRKVVSKRTKILKEEGLIEGEYGDWRMTPKGSTLIAGLDEAGRLS